MGGKPGAIDFVGGRRQSVAQVIDKILCTIGFQLLTVI